MSEHTPGPWVRTSRRGEGHDTHWDIHHKSEGRDGGYFCRVEVLHRTAEAIATGEANAQLIATAPILLRDAVALLEALDWDGVGHDQRQGRVSDAARAMRATIEKARGGA